MSASTVCRCRRALGFKYKLATRTQDHQRADIHHPFFGATDDVDDAIAVDESSFEPRRARAATTRSVRCLVGRENETEMSARTLRHVHPKPDAFYREVRQHGPVTRHFFGNASFRATFKGCVPAPKTLVARRSRMAFLDTPFELVDEYLTTQCCWRCRKRTQPVTCNGAGRQDRVVRGLVFYSRTCGRFTDRDFQGALNIGFCGIGPRPTQLDRNKNTGKRRRDARVIPAKSSHQCGLSG